MVSEMFDHSSSKFNIYLCCGINRTSALSTNPFEVKKMMFCTKFILLALNLASAGSVLADGNVWHHNIGVARINNLNANLVGNDITLETINSNKSSASARKDRNSDEEKNENEDEDGRRRQADRQNSQNQDAWTTPSAINTDSEDSAIGACNLNGSRIRVAVSPQPPLVNCLQNLYGDWICNGSNIEVINVLERHLNFQADWLVLADNQLTPTSAAGRQSLRQYSLANSDNEVLENKSPSSNSRKQISNQSHNGGVLGLIGSGRAWLSANGMMQTVERQQNDLLLMSEPFDSFRIHFLLSKSVRDHDHIFVKPFSANAWIAILGSALIIVPIFYLINSTSSHYLLQNDKFLQQIPVLNCLRHLFLGSSSMLIGDSSTRNRRRNKTGKVCNIGLCRPCSSHSTSSLSSTFDDEVDKMILSGGALNLEPQAISAKSEQRRRQKAARRQWALERHKARRVARASRQSGFFKPAYIVWYVVSSLAAQGGETEDLPHASSTRILVAFWWLYLIVICSIHSGILTAILTFPKQNDFIQTLDDFLALDESGNSMKLMVDRSSELAQLLSNPDNLHKSPLKVLLEFAQNEAKPSYAEGKNRDQTAATTRRQPIEQVDFQRYRQRVLDEVQRGQSAYMEEKSTINMIISQEYFDNRPPKCQFKSSKQPIDVLPMSLALSRKFSPKCLQSINKLLRHIMRTGLAQKWRRKYETQGNDCLNSVIINAGDVDKIEMRHVVLAFWLLLSGLALGLVSLVAEVVWLFTADFDDDDDDNSETDSNTNSNSSLRLNASSSSSSSDSEGPRFGYKLGQLARRSLEPLGRIKINKSRPKRSSGLPFLPPKPILAPIGSEDSAEVEQLSKDERLAIKHSQRKDKVIGFSRKNTNQVAKSRQEERRRRKAIKAAERRARRMKRTVELMRKLHEGKVYADVFAKVSDRLQSRARRASNALIHLAHRRPLKSLASSGKPSQERQQQQQQNPALRQSLGGPSKPNSPQQPLDGPIRRRRLGAGSGGAKVAPGLI